MLVPLWLLYGIYYNFVGVDVELQAFRWLIVIPFINWLGVLLLSSVLGQNENSQSVPIE